MIHGNPVESRWLRPQPRRTVPRNLLRKVVKTVFPGHSVVDVVPLSDGFRNANFKVHLDSTPEFVVLRIYEHDASLCRKEVDLIDLIGRSFPIPEVIHAEPAGIDDLPPFVLLRYIEGIAFRELKHRGDRDSISQAAYEIGRTLALLGRTTFPRSGWIGPGSSVTAPVLEGINPGPRFVDLCLASANVEQRMDAELRDRTSALVWSYSTQLASLDGQTHLVHGDFGSRNLLVHQVDQNWTVAGVLDWEFATAGSSLTDVGHFLRYESSSLPVVEPHFSQGYLQAGGRLAPIWRRLSRVVDLIALCESLTHDALPDPVLLELLELVRATVEDRDPRLTACYRRVNLSL
jgi:aminoglycoside phosphotransferase (APT) family kinase protein